MANDPARPAFSVERIPASRDSTGRANWRIADADDNRIATCYLEENARQIVDALNGAPIVADPTAVAMVLENAAKLADMAKRNGGPAGAELAGIAAILAKAARRLGGDEPTAFEVNAAAFGEKGDAGIMSQSGRLVLMITPAGKTSIDRDATAAELREALEYLVQMYVAAETPDAATIEDVVHDMRKVRPLRATKDGEFLSITPDEMRSVLRGRIRRLRRQPVTELRREGALEHDPYAFEGQSFADVARIEAMRNEDRSTLIVRQRVIDDVAAAHRMLDNLHMPAGLLTERIGHMIFAASSKFATISGPKVEGSISAEDVLRSAHSIASRDTRVGPGMDDPIRREPLADADSVTIPDADSVLADLDKLTGEEAFRIFDRVKVLPGNTAEARNWNLVEPYDVRRMVAECCSVAFNVGKLGELAKAAREAVERKGER